MLECQHHCDENLALHSTKDHDLHLINNHLALIGFKHDFLPVTFELGNFGTTDTAMVKTGLSKKGVATFKIPNHNEGTFNLMLEMYYSPSCKY